tara:strand:+ start:8576 stop:10561 length:1986 start_codon:yes stop_codon:yes gene_type:complete
MKLDYRPEIDGLRAIAILSVIFYHSEIYLFQNKFLSGGFLGVDIFFVISGYLITLIILNEKKITGNFSLKKFYIRRLRRLMPALTVVCLTTFAFGYFILLPSGLIELSKSSIFSLFYLSNFYFYFSQFSYGTESVLLKPLLHTWSLGVEEQFYIVFPIFFLIILNKLKNRVLTLLSFFIILNLIAVQFLGNLNFRNIIDENLLFYAPTKFTDFYFITSRFWELLSGSLIAYLNFNNKYIQKNKSTYSFFPYLGLIIIIFSLIFFKVDFYHPSILTALPIIGTCLIILFVSKNTFIYKLLSSKILVWIGLMSYSLYLWHYPLFAFNRYLTFEPNTFIRQLIIGILLFFIGYISYKYIEQPFRNKKLISTKFFINLTMFTISISLFVYLFSINKDGFLNKTQITKNYNLDKGYYMREHDEFQISQTYDNFDRSNKTDILIVGNSHAEDTYEVFFWGKENYKDFNFTLINPKKTEHDMAFQISCFYNLIYFEKTNCRGREYGNYIVEQYKNAEIIILSTKWYKKDLELVNDIIQKIIEDKKKPIIFGNTLELKEYTNFKFNLLDHFIYKSKRIPDEKEMLDLEKKAYKNIKNTKKINSYLEKLSKKKEIIYLDKINYLCDKKEKKCKLLTPEGFKIFYDNQHYTKKGAQYLAKEIFKKKWLNFN